MVLTLFMIFIFAFCMLANIAVQIINAVLNAILAPLFGMKIIGASIFGIMIFRKKDGWKVSFHRLSPVCVCHLGYDIREQVSEDAEKKEKQMVYLVMVLVLLISLLAAFMYSDYIFRLFQGRMNSPVDVYISVFVVSFVAGMLFFAVSHIGISIYSLQVSIKRMGGYTQEAIKKLCRGYSYEALHLKPLKGLPFNNVTDAEKISYYKIYVYYLVSVGQVEELHRVSREIAEILEKHEVTLLTMDLHSWLVYYYSKYSIDSQRAEEFFAKAGSFLKKDSDADAKRILGQYYFRVRGDLEKAGQYVKEGLACVENIQISGQQKLEKKLLEELAEELLAANAMPHYNR